MRQRVGNERDTEKVRPHIDQGQTHTVHRNRAFWHHPAGQFRSTHDEQPHIFLLAAPLLDGTGTVHMPLDNVAIIAAISPQGTLEIDPAARAELTEIGDAGRFLHHLETQSSPSHGNNSEIGAIDGNTVSQVYAFHNRATLNAQLHHLAPRGHGDHRADIFHNTCKHNPSDVHSLTIDIAYHIRPRPSVAQM